MRHQAQECCLMLCVHSFVLTACKMIQIFGNCGPTDKNILGSFMNRLNTSSSLNTCIFTDLLGLGSLPKILISNNLT